MNNITKQEFVELLQELNPGERDNLKVGEGIDKIVYTGNLPLDSFKLPETFEAVKDDCHQGFSDLPFLLGTGGSLKYRFFIVEKE